LFGPNFRNLKKIHQLGDLLETH